MDENKISPINIEEENNTTSNLNHSTLDDNTNTTEYQTAKDCSDGYHIDFSTEFFPQIQAEAEEEEDANDLQSDDVPKLLINNIPLSNNPKLVYQANAINIISNIAKAQNEEFSRLMISKDRIAQEDFDILKGSFFNIVTSQNGSRLMQKVYTNSSPEILEQIFNELLPQLCALMVDPYANYFCQKFYLILSQESKLKYLMQLAQGIVSIAKSKIGTHSCQAVLSLLKGREEKAIIVQALSGHVLDLCNDAMGVHLIEKIVVCFEEELIAEVYDTIISHFAELAQSPNGLFVCKKAIAHAKNFSTLARIRDVIKDNSMMLIKNQYGNYTIQIAIDNWPCDLCQPVIESFSGHFFNLSMEKYSSNVIEKCLEKSDEKQLMNFIEEITKSNCIINMMKNSFGNYVIQKALKLVQGKTKTKLVAIIKKSIDKLSDNKLITKWKGILNSSNRLSLGKTNRGLKKDNLNNSGSFSGNGSFDSNHSPKQIKSTDTKQKASKSYNQSLLMSESTVYSPVMGNPMMQSSIPHSPIMLSSQFAKMNMAMNTQEARSPIALTSNRLMINSPIANSNNYLHHFNQLPLQTQQFPVQNIQWGYFPQPNILPSNFRDL